VKKSVRIAFKNGITYQIAIKEILNELVNEYDFLESDHPDFILFGPYGNDIPAPGKYTRIGYFCENIIPDFSICEWAFGIPLEEEINRPNYKRIQWHGFDPEGLIKNLHDNEIDRVFNSHTKFCNFIYSNPVQYRQDFFQQLSKYKHVDAPGKSMNNMPSIDTKYQGDVWQRKRQFLSEYKFTIAFENYSYPGYQTEKLYDAMQAGSVPIYCGDPAIGDIFNTDSFLNAPDYVNMNISAPIRFLEKISQADFKDIRPQFLNSPADRIKRKFKSIGRKLKMRIQFNKLDFSDLIDRIIELDKNPALYKQYLRTPWLKNNKPSELYSTAPRWREIFG
jgi:hypothetical protein